MRFQGFNGRRRFVHAFFSSDSGELDIREHELRNLHRGERASYDCHVHTNHSDGERTPEQLAYEAYNGGCSVVVTDHYCLSGADSALAAHRGMVDGGGSEAESIVIPGVEFSARVEIPAARQLRKLHILGVGVDTSNRRLNDWLANYRRNRGMDIGHALEVKADLEDAGFRFHSDIVSRLSSRRNVYQVLVESMFAKMENHRLIERRFGLKIRALASRHKRRKKNIQSRRKLVRCMREEYGDFTAQKPLLEEVLSLIRGAGGVAVVAHPVASVPQLPYFSVRKMADVFAELEAVGVDGIEAYNPHHRLEVADAIAKAGLDAGLMVTGGSDAHRLDQEMGRLVKVQPWPVRQCMPSGQGY